MALRAKPLRLSTAAPDFDAQLRQRLHWSAGTDAQVETAIGAFTCRIPGDAGIGETVFMVIRPEDIVIRREQSEVNGNMLRGFVATTHFHGSLTDCVIQVGTQSMRVHTRPQSAPTKGETVDLHLPAEHCFAIRAT